MNDALLLAALIAVVIMLASKALGLVFRLIVISIANFLVLSSLVTQSGAMIAIASCLITLVIYRCLKLIRGIPLVGKTILNIASIAYLLFAFYYNMSSLNLLKGLASVVSF